MSIESKNSDERFISDGQASEENRCENPPSFVIPEWLTPDFYSKAYDRFIRLRRTIDPFPGEDPHLDPNAFELPSEDINRLGILFFGYNLINLSSHRLTGQINGMYDDILNLKAWEQILPDYNERQKLHLIVQFVEPLLVASLISPFAVKNQMVFVGTKIAILLEQGKRKNKIPADREIKSIADMEEWAGKWPGFPELKIALSTLHSEDFTESTMNFRHRYTHRLPPRIGMGIVPNFRLEREGTGLRIYPHMDEPLAISTAIAASVMQHRACVAAFHAFWFMLKSKLVTM